MSNDRMIDGWGLAYCIFWGLAMGAAVGALLVVFFLPRACGAEDAQALPPSLVVAIEGEETVAVVADPTDCWELASWVNAQLRRGGLEAWSVECAEEGL